jgi:Response regulator containing a CheY-like receiver domain and an HTH DNA-binding domain
MQKKEDKIQEAYRYHCKGLNSKEIAKILNCSYRTIQGYMCSGNWNKTRLPTDVMRLAVTMINKGYTRKQVAKQLKVSVSTVDNYRRAVLQNKN